MVQTVIVDDKGQAIGDWQQLAGKVFQADRHYTVSDLIYCNEGVVPRAYIDKLVVLSQATVNDDVIMVPDFSYTKEYLWLSVDFDLDDDNDEEDDDMIIA